MLGTGWTLQAHVASCWNMLTLDCASLSTIMDGLDLLIHRAENNLMGTSVDSSTLYLCKIFILSELAIENSKSSVQCSDDVIRSAMDGIQDQPLSFC